MLVFDRPRPLLRPQRLVLRLVVGLGKVVRRHFSTLASSATRSRSSYAVFGLLRHCTQIRKVERSTGRTKKKTNRFVTSCVAYARSTYGTTSSINARLRNSRKNTRVRARQLGEAAFSTQLLRTQQLQQQQHTLSSLGRQDKTSTYEAIVLTRTTSLLLL